MLSEYYLNMDTKIMSHDYSFTQKYLGKTNLSNCGYGWKLDIKVPFLKSIS